MIGKDDIAIKKTPLKDGGVRFDGRLVFGMTCVVSDTSLAQSRDPEGLLRGQKEMLIERAMRDLYGELHDRLCLLKHEMRPLAAPGGDGPLEWRAKMEHLARVHERFDELIAMTEGVKP